VFVKIIAGVLNTSRHKTIPQYVVKQNEQKLLLKQMNFK